jgi:hypothetical protein
MVDEGRNRTIEKSLVPPPKSATRINSSRAIVEA